MIRNILSLLVALTGLTTAYFPPEPEGITVLKSKFHKDVTISYKEVGRTFDILKQDQ